jgi:hypothetical protein
MIPDLDRWLLELMTDQPKEPRRYVLRCHPAAYAAIKDAADRAAGLEWPVRISTGAPGLYGSAELVVDPELGPDGWELCEHGQVLKSGRVGGGRTEPLPAYVYLHGHWHRHGIAGPAWREHSHFGAGIPHRHDPDTGFQVPLGDADAPA